MSTLENFRLKVFRIVAEKRSFRQAAETLFLRSLPLLYRSRHWKQSSGDFLFHHSAGGIGLTEAGRKLLRYAERLQKIAAAAEHDISALQGLGVEPSAHRRFHLYRSVHSSSVNRRVSPAESEGRSLRSGREHRSDCLRRSRRTACCVKHDRRSVSSGVIIKVEPFLTDNIAVIAPAHHEWTGQRISIHDLATAPLWSCASDGSGTRRVVETALKNAGLHRKSILVGHGELDSTEAIKSARRIRLGYRIRSPNVSHPTKS